ncbi:hypothetical protein B0H14DRAFT_3434147 [Mycena olivaceomarginata]|nr:hypothetical protein B0H14DRAFT_3434147 [Mycena olivaceomarginata]
MPFAKTSTTSPPQTVKSLARMHVKVPDSNHHTIVSWLQPRKAPRPAVGYRRVMHTSPPAALPTLRLLSIGRRHSSPSSVSQNVPHPSHLSHTRIAGPAPTTPVSPSPKPTAEVSHAKRGAPLIARTDAGSPGEKRRHGVPAFGDDIQVILKDVLRVTDREEQEEKLLTELLNGRVVGGQSRYKRVKMVPASERVDASSAWMTTLF